MQIVKFSLLEKLVGLQPQRRGGVPFHEFSLLEKLVGLQLLLFKTDLTF